MTLGYGAVLKDPIIETVAAAHGATPAQVALAWAMQLGYAVIPSSTKRANLQSNLLAQELRLSDDQDGADGGPGAQRPARRARGRGTGLGLTRLTSP